jgi:acyl-CoA thioesterase FadM
LNVRFRRGIRTRVIETSVHLPRHAFSARDAARAGDVWRAFQELAVEASTVAGWPPSRYRDEGAAFVVRSMLVVHQGEARYGEAIVGSTWVSRMRREMFSTRELRLVSPRGPIASARQEWVHVSASLEPTRGSASLLASFLPEPGPDGDDGPILPVAATAHPPHAPHLFELEAFWTWMDPLDHANHPAYLDWCDEATSRALAAASVPPIRLVPIAEEVTFKSGVVAGDRVRVETTVRGTTPGNDVVLSHRIFAGAQLSATATTVRRILGEADPSILIAAVSSAAAR